jgi:hypothetical protein
VLFDCREFLSVPLCGIRVHPWLKLFLPPDGSGTTTTMATGLFNHKIQILFDFVM